MSNDALTATSRGRAVVSDGPVDALRPLFFNPANTYYRLVRVRRSSAWLIAPFDQRRAGAIVEVRTLAVVRQSRWFQLCRNWCAQATAAA